MLIIKTRKILFYLTFSVLRFSLLRFLALRFSVFMFLVFFSAPQLCWPTFFDSNKSSWEVCTKDVKKTSKKMEKQFWKEKKNVRHDFLKGPHVCKISCDRLAVCEKLKMFSVYRSFCAVFLMLLSRQWDILLLAILK